MNQTDAVILVGHGGIPNDMPRNLVQELMRLEGERSAKKIKQMSAREIELDHQIRHWPRSAKTDPYQQGLESIEKKLAPLLTEKKLVLAYNEFCFPSLQEVVHQLIKENFKTIQILTTMFTPGGSHAEIEIPEIVHELSQQYPNVKIKYLWPYPMQDVAELLALRIKQEEKNV